ncbi:MAG: hypothetical protein QOG85_574, partial [Gaiellaceae bacterium]|nr:hypothetical protein [Gaiellaceae bacterium]
MKHLVLPLAVILLAVGGYGIYRATSSSTRGSSGSVVPSPYAARGMDVEQMFAALRERGSGSRS